MLDIFRNIIKSLTLKDIFYIFIICLLCCLFIRQCNTNINNEKIYENNVTALTDSIVYYKSKTDDLIATKTAFECDIKELKNLNETLYDEIKDLKIKNEILASSHVTGKVENPSIDTTFIVESDTIDYGFKHDFKFNNEWRQLEGYVSYFNKDLKLQITKDIVNFDYTFAIDNENKLYIKSNNPYVTYESYSGFVVPKEKQKRFTVGPSFGYGWGLTTKKSDLFIGLNVTWNVFSF